LWKAPNLLLVPHVGGNSSAFEPRGRALVQSQLALLAAGKPLEHVVAQG
jgi:phosphoglycerate dehydrogenase-like enzyme